MQARSTLVDQTKSIERAVGALKLNAIAFEGSDSLDAPGQGVPVRVDSRARKSSIRE